MPLRNSKIPVAVVSPHFIECADMLRNRARDQLGSVIDSLIYEPELNGKQRFARVWREYPEFWQGLPRKWFNILCQFAMTDRETRLKIEEGRAHNRHDPFDDVKEV